MPTPTIAGQYREVEYADDGCTIYQCLWCLGTVEVRDNPEYGWNFCPKCGKSWFNRVDCRKAGTPRWFWDRFGDPEKCTGDEYSLVYKCWGSPKITREWVIESRHRVWDRLGDDWSNWGWARSVEIDSRKLGAWKDVAYHLRMLRGAYHSGLTTEYRVRIVDK